ncbi:hypothetical protein M758_11G113400 [Ceratodon purpureus]|nr:hypothetical protein M758_11G113400 [Ceratodon purpureus]
MATVLAPSSEGTPPFEAPNDVPLVAPDVPVAPSSEGTPPFEAPNDVPLVAPDVPVAPSSEGTPPFEAPNDVPLVAPDVPVAPSSEGTPPFEAPNDVPMVLPPPVVPPTGYVTINIPMFVPVSCLPPGGLSPGAGSGPDPPVFNPVGRPTGEIWINNLVDMQIKNGDDVGPDDRKKLVALAALKQWEETHSELVGTIERKTNQMDKIIFEIYQLVGLYSVFVGVVLTAAVQSSNFQCQHIWSPVLMCVAACLFIILMTRQRLKRYKELRATIKYEDKARREIYGKIGKLKSIGHVKFDFAIDDFKLTSTASTRPKSTCGIRVTASRFIPFVLTSFTLILVGSFIHILCLKDITSRLH